MVSTWGAVCDFLGQFLARSAQRRMEHVMQARLVVVGYGAVAAELVGRLRDQARRGLRGGGAVALRLCIALTRARGRRLPD